MSAGGAGAVVRHGYLRKLKTMKRKYFVLRAESADCSARLEYYESEKKFRSGATPRRVIPLKTCFNITRRLDLKQRHVIALYTKEEQFCVVAEGEDDLHTWLTDLLRQHQNEDTIEELLHPTQHVWQVNVQKKGLGASKNILGLYNLCLTDKSLTLVKVKANNSAVEQQPAVDGIEFTLKNIRRCGDSECFFYMEVGRQTATGAGELWMHTDDANIAQSMHSTILHAMSTCREETLPRLRSASANEDPRPRRAAADARARAAAADAPQMRNRCDSMPSRTCPPLDADRTPSRYPDLGESGEPPRDEPDSSEWHRTPRIPEEPDYCEMSPMDIMNMIIKKMGGSAGQSRSSSLAAESPPPAGYLPMAPAERALSASSGSVCSGTPSTDPRFSEYQLEPATAHVTDEETRPPRAYSVGSRPAAAPPPARLRAYSVGARTRRGPAPASAPAPAPAPAPADLMELDFSGNSPKTKVIVASTPPSAGFIPPPARKPRAKLDEYVDMSPRAAAAGDYLDMAPRVATTPDGYVEMHYAKRAPTRPITIASGSARVEPPAPELGSQTLFPLSLDSPLSPPRTDDRELHPADVFDEDLPHHPLATVREISEENPRRSPEVGSPPHYVKLSRPTSQPIAAPPKSSESDADELSCNPTATKTWAGDPKPPRFGEERKSSSPAPSEHPGLNYAALDLDPRPPAPPPASRPYTQIDFARSEKMHTADAN